MVCVFAQMFVYLSKLCLQMEGWLHNTARFRSSGLGQILARARAVPRSIIVRALSLQAQVRRNELTETEATEKLRAAPLPFLPFIIRDRRDLNPRPSA